MMKKQLYVFFCLLLTLGLHTATFFHSSGQAKVFKPKVTLLIPLYLDSAFEGGKYRFGNTMPSHIANGLDFYNGARIAAAELDSAGISALIHIIDTRSPDFMDQYFRDTASEGTGIVIAASQSAAEMKAIAEKLRPLGIPLISMLPNDAGIGGYPQMLLANSTLKTHCEQVYRLVQRNHSIDNLVLLTPQGNVEGRLKQYLIDENKKTASVPLKWREVELTDATSAESLSPFLDSNQLNVLIVPTLSGPQAQRTVKMLSSLAPKYRSAVVGMPTWETASFTKSEYKGIDVWYGTPFVTLSGNAELTEDFTKRFKALTNARPGDMGFRGYEITLRYLKTLLAYPEAFLQHINDRQFRMFNDFDFKPVSLRENGQIDYRENKKVYFIKKTDGVIKTVITP